MNASSIRHRAASRSTRWLAAAMLAALAAGCGDQVTQVDSGFTAPEGTPSARSRLVAYADRTVEVQYWADFSPPGPGGADAIDFTDHVRPGTPATVHGLIVDGTPAMGYQVYRREEGGGVGRLLDYVVEPSKRWLDKEWEYYTFQDDDPTRTFPPTYHGRGLLSGAATASSPVTNPASSGDTTLVDIGLSIVFGNPPNTPYIDSLFTVRWNAIPGAAGYYLHAYQYRGDLREEAERILTGMPAPICEGKIRDIYAAYLPATITQHKIGEAGGDILTWRKTFYGQVYMVRVSAVDSEGRMIAFPTNPNTIGYRIGPYDNGYTLQPVGAIFVSPSRSPFEPQAAATGTRVEAPAALAGPGRMARIFEADGQRFLQLER